MHVFQALSKQPDQSFRGKYSIEGALLPNADLEVHSDVKMTKDGSNTTDSRGLLRPSLQHLKWHTKTNVSSAEAPPDKASQSLLDILQVC